MSNTQTQKISWFFHVLGGISLLAWKGGLTFLGYKVSPAFYVVAGIFLLLGVPATIINLVRECENRKDSSLCEKPPTM